jgi:hypothetical protein
MINKNIQLQNNMFILFTRIDCIKMQVMNFSLIYNGTKKDHLLASFFTKILNTKKITYHISKHEPFSIVK